MEFNMIFFSFLKSIVEDFGRTYPRLGNLIFGTHAAYVRVYVWAITQYQNFKYDAPIDPYQVYWIDPNQIENTLINDFWWQPFTSIKGGSWDRNTGPLNETMRKQSLERHFTKDIPWEETNYYDHLLAKINKNGRTRFGSSEAELLESLEQYDRLYSSIKNGEYKTQRELRGNNEPPRGIQRRHLPPELLEVAVAVGRDGEWIHDDGGHRLIIAQILELEQIPVRIIARHRQWQAIRDEMVNSDRNELTPEAAKKYSQHADIESLTQSSK